MYNFNTILLFILTNLPFCITAQTSQNLLVNGDFSNDKTGWNFSVISPAQATGSVVNGEFVVSITNGSTESWHIQLMQSGLLIENGKKYMVSFDAYAASPRDISAAFIKDWTGEWTGYHYQTFAITTAKRKYKFEFYINDPTAQKGKFYFDLGNSSEDVYIDNVTVYEKEITGALVNGDFTSGDDYWFAWTHSEATAYGSVQNKEYMMSISNGGTQASYIQLMQTDLWIEQGKSYTIIFDAYAEQPREINVIVQHQSDPWTIYDIKQVNLTTTRQMFSASFTMSETTDLKSRLVFEFGLSDADVYLDNISLSMNMNAPQPPFKRGFNFADWFEQFSPIPYMDFKRYTKENFEDAKSLGCDHIRLPLKIFNIMGPGPDYTIPSVFFTFLDQAMDWAEQLGMYLILDNHSYDGTITADHTDQLKAGWVQLANRYKNRSNLICYEIFNEPHGLTDETWNDMQGQLIETIRAIDNKHTIIVTPVWGDYEKLQSMPVYNDTNLIYTFHFYFPGIFTHQGAYWVEPDLTNLANIPFPYNAARMPELPSEYVGTWVEQGYNYYYNDGTYTRIQSLLDNVAAFRDERQILVWCGEFGIYKVNCQQEDRIRWLTKVHSYLEDIHISWTMWEYGNGFGIYENDRELFQYDVNTPIIEALGLTVPQQSEFVLVPDTTGFTIYDDFLPQRVSNSSWSTGGDFNLNYLSNNNPAEGDFCISWTGADLYSFIGFRFPALHDLTQLVQHGYMLNMWMRCTKNDAKFELRFLDTKTNDPNDHPWRMHYTINNTEFNWDSSWQHIQIPLSSFVEQGSFDDGTWYNPQGKFDWSQIEKFEIGSDYSDLKNIVLDIDDIKIIEPSGNIQKPYLGNAVALPGLIEVENYDIGGQDVAYWDSDAGNSGGQYRQEDVDIEICDDTNGGYNIGWIVNNEWLEYTVDVLETNMNIEVRAASPFSGGKITFLLDNESLGSVDIPNTGGYQSWQTLKLENIHFEKGQNRILKLLLSNGNFNINWIKFATITDAVITETDVPVDFELNQNYPNPFNPTTSINYSVSKTSFVTIKLFNFLGQFITILVNEEKKPGNYTLKFNASRLTSGIYFCKMQAGSFEQTKKLALIK